MGFRPAILVKQHRCAQALRKSATIVQYKLQWYVKVCDMVGAT